MNNSQEVGFVEEVKNFLVYIEGLPTARVKDLVESETGAYGWVNSLLEDKVEVFMLDEKSIQPGMFFKKSDKKLTFPVGEFLIGRTLNPIGIPLDGKGPLSKSSNYKLIELDHQAPEISKRRFITEQFSTGISLIDSLIPIGKGQRQLIMGDPRSGKTGFILDIIFNQSKKDVICIYSLIGKSITEVRSIVDTLETNNAMDHTIVIAASSTDVSPLIFIAPQAALSVAEYFQQMGKDVLVILDDLGSHAKVYREMSLLSNKIPGRESYGGDMFYQQAHMMERAGCFNEQNGGGSITALPVIELNLNDFTSLIPTNLMAMTDGHLLFKADLANQGKRPAVDIGLSVTRVGNQTQTKLQRTLSFRIKQLIYLSEQLETVSRFSSELPAETRNLLLKREQIAELLNQDPHQALPLQIQSLILSLVLTDFFAQKNQYFIQKNKNTLISAFMTDPSFELLLDKEWQNKTVDELVFKLKPYLPKLESLCQP